MAAFTSAFNPSGLMATNVDGVVQLDSIFAEIGYHAFTWPIK